MAVTARDQHGTYTRKRQAEGPPLDRATTRWFAVVANQWSKPQPNKTAAQRVEREMKARADRGVRTTAMTFGAFLHDVWLANVEAKVRRGNMKPTTASHYRIVVAKYVEPTLGPVKLKDLKPEHLRKLYASLADRGLAPKSVRNVHVLVSNALALALADDYVPKNVALGLDVAPKVVKGAEMKAWNAEQVRTFLASVADDRLHAAWRLSALTGLRRGELLALRWDDLDLKARTLRVGRALVVDPESHALVWTTPKSERSRRTIDLDPVTVDALKAHRKAQAAEQLASMGAWPSKGNEAGLVFTDEVGRAVRPNTFSRRFDAALKATGLPRIRLHDLRHSAASIMLGNGEAITEVAAMLGHAETSTTLNVYAHALPGRGRERAARLAAAIDGE